MMLKYVYKAILLSTVCVFSDFSLSAMERSSDQEEKKSGNENHTFTFKMPVTQRELELTGWLQPESSLENKKEHVFLPFIGESMEDVIAEIDEYLEQHIVMKTKMMEELQSILDLSQTNFKKAQQKFEKLTGIQLLSDEETHQITGFSSKDKLRVDLSLKKDLKHYASTLRDTHKSPLIYNATTFRRDLYDHLSETDFKLPRNEVGASLISAYANEEKKMYEDALGKLAAEGKLTPIVRKLYKDEVSFYHVLLAKIGPYWWGRDSVDSEGLRVEVIRQNDEYKVRSIEAKIKKEQEELEKKKLQKTSSKNSKQKKNSGKKKPSQKPVPEKMSLQESKEEIKEEIQINPVEKTLTSDVAFNQIKDFPKSISSEKMQENINSKPLPQEKDSVTITFSEEEDFNFDPKANHENYDKQKKELIKEKTKSKETSSLLQFETDHIKAKSRSFFKSVFDNKSEIEWDSLKNLVRTSFNGKIYGTSGSSRQFAFFLKFTLGHKIEFISEDEFNKLRKSKAFKVERRVVHTEAPHSRGASTKGQTRFLYPALKVHLQESLKKIGITPESLGW
ncbi:hypothetical protein Bealeia1_00466 [Candidatus Bealeia paramacronuclearis]|uniref:Uncharacterized protein n=1 Tax=Candidatus Bealeia paramacronuclearis TaxID=1921001 RepID=A0ABZ2C3E3_9PROT|nr:hypothetical protein [Candidatus Bealeia paramacronuclearis]